jgi:hypothetical protein
MSAVAEKVSSFVLSAEEADALGWVDLAEPVPAPKPPRAPVADPANDPIFLGTVNASQRGVKGEVSLDVLVDPTGAWIEIGPLHFKCGDAFFLGNLISIAKHIQPKPVCCTVCPPWEGETRP